MPDSYDYYSLTNLKAWNRKVIFAYWGIVGIYLVFTSLNFFFTDKDKVEFLVKAILQPLGEFIIVMVLTEIAYRAYAMLAPYIIVVSGNLLIAILVTSLYEKIILLPAFLLPLIISAFYFHKRLIRFSLFLTLIIFIVSFLIVKSRNPVLSHSDFIGMFSLILGGGFVLLTLMKRGEELIGAIRDSILSQQTLISEKSELEQLARTDSLTGLFNQRAFNEFVQKLIVENKDNPHPSLQLVVLDIDNFKLINDTYGHDIGDRILEWLSTIIKELRDDYRFAARYGGEEFVLVYEKDSLQACEEAMEAFREKIASTPHSILGGQAITVSIGIHSYYAGFDLKEWFSGADSALYKAKRSGKNQVCSFTR